MILLFLCCTVIIASSPDYRNAKINHYNSVLVIRVCTRIHICDPCFLTFNIYNLYVYSHTTFHEHTYDITIRNSSERKHYERHQRIEWL
jgi:hypothetical protein